LVGDGECFNLVSRGILAGCVEELGVDTCRPGIRTTAEGNEVCLDVYAGGIIVYAQINEFIILPELIEAREPYGCRTDLCVDICAKEVGIKLFIVTRSG